MGFDYTVQLLDHDDLGDLGCEVLYELFRKGIHHAQFQDRVLVAAHFLHIVVAG